MAEEKKAKKEAGAVATKTVVQLRRAKYAVSLHYLGRHHVATDEPRYRGNFVLYKNKGVLTSLAPPMPNVVRGKNPDKKSKEAATPALAGGGLANPTGDIEYKLAVTDNHALPGADTDLLGDKGDNVSRNRYYKRADRKWWRDVFAYVPFRVVVRKYLTDKDGKKWDPVDMPDDVQVCIEIKDPAEDTSYQAGPVRPFLRDFFAKYNRKGLNPSKGEDNAHLWFGGLRQVNWEGTTYDHPGGMAASVIRSMPVIEPPFVDQPPPKKSAIAPHRLKRVNRWKEMLGKLDLTVRQDKVSKKKVGMADLALRSFAIGGDNYRFLLSLIAKADGTDLRKKKFNNVYMSVVDDQKTEIPHPRAYTTGRILVFRRVNVPIVLCMNRVKSGNIQWGWLKKEYGHAFTHMRLAKKALDLSRQGWRRYLKEAFGAGGAFKADFNNVKNFEGPAGKKNSTYEKGLFPQFLLNAWAGDTWAQKHTNLRKFCRHCLTRAAAFKKLKDPVETNIKTPGDGMLILYCKNNLTAGLAGMYMGDGMLLVCHLVSNKYTSETAVHELGHGFFLRHSCTGKYQTGGGNPFAADYVDAAGKKASVFLIDATSNCWPQDHDTDYAFKCIMSYMQEQHFCGMCALNLRFYDRQAIQRARHYSKGISKGLFPASICRITVPVAATMELNEKIPSIKVNKTVKVAAISAERPFVLSDDGKNYKGRINISCAAKSPDTLWSVSNAAILSVKTVGGYCAEVKGKAAGKAKVFYKRDGHSASAEIEVKA